MQPSSPDPFAPATLGPLKLANRIIKAATFEGMAHENLATDALVQFHREMAAGGVGMSTVAYLAISRDGQGAPAEIILDSLAIPGLRRVTDAIHAEGGKAAAQIGHAGTGVGWDRPDGPLALEGVLQERDEVHTRCRRRRFGSYHT